MATAFQSFYQNTQQVLTFGTFAANTNATLGNVGTVPQNELWIFQFLSFNAGIAFRSLVICNHAPIFSGSALTLNGVNDTHNRRAYPINIAGGIDLNAPQATSINTTGFFFPGETVFVAARTTANSSAVTQMFYRLLKFRNTNF